MITSPFLPGWGSRPGYYRAILTTGHRAVQMCAALRFTDQQQRRATLPVWPDSGPADIDAAEWDRAQS